MTVVMADTSWLTVQDVARWLNKSESTVLRLVAREELPVATFGERGFRINRSDVVAFIRKCYSGSDVAAGAAGSNQDLVTKTA